MFKTSSCFSDDEVEKNLSSFPVSTLCSFMLSCSDLKYSDNAIYMPLFQSPCTINRLHTPDFVKWKYKKVWVKLLKCLYIIIHMEYMSTSKSKHNICSENLTSFYLETLFVPSVSCICSKNLSYWYCIYMFQKLYLLFQKPSLCFQPSTRFPIYSSSCNIFTVSLSKSDHICLHIVFLRNRKHLPCIIHYPLVSVVRVCSSHIMGCGCV